MVRVHPFLPGLTQTNHFEWVFYSQKPYCLVAFLWFLITFYRLLQSRFLNKKSRIFSKKPSKTIGVFVNFWPFYFANNCTVLWHFYPYICKYWFVLVYSKTQDISKKKHNKIDMHASPNFLFNDNELCPVFGTNGVLCL